MRETRFADCLECMVKSRMAKRFAWPEYYRQYYRPRHRRENAAVQGRTAVCEQDLRRAAFSWIETAVNCTVTLNIHLAAIFDHCDVVKCNIFPWRHCSINSTKIPITHPAASTTKIGATVTMLTSTVDGCLSGFFEANKGLNILSWIPLSRICANLWRKLYYVKGLMFCYFKRIVTKIWKLCIEYTNVSVYNTTWHKT